MKTKTALLGTLLVAVWTATTLAETSFAIDRPTDSAGSSKSAARVAFVSAADLVPGGNADGNPEIFLFDKKGFTQITNSSNCSSSNPKITQSGSRIVFISTCDLVPGSNADNNREVFFFDAKTGLSQITQALGGDTLFPAVDGRGNRIAFISDLDLVPGSNADLNFEVFLFDPESGFTQVTHSAGGQEEVAAEPSLGNNGKWIAFELNGELPPGSSPESNGEVYVSEQK